MTKAQIMDIISRLPRCDGQGANAVSAYTLVKMEDAHKLLKVPKSECPDIWIRLPRHKWLKSWSSVEDSVVPLERNLYGPLTELLRERQFEKMPLKHEIKKIPNSQYLFVHREKGLFSSVCANDIKLTGKKTKSWPDVETIQQRSRFGDPKSFLDHVYLGCTQRQCEISRDIVDNYRVMFESRISAEGSKKLPFLKIFVFLHCRMTWLVVQRSVWKDIVSWQTKRLNNSTKYLLHVSMITTSKKKKLNLLENCQIHALKLFWYV